MSDTTSDGIVTDPSYQKRASYLQFPIAALRLHKNISDLSRDEMKAALRDIVGYCLWSLSDRLTDAHGDDLVTWIRDEQPELGEPECDRQIGIVAAARTIGVRLHSLDVAPIEESFTRIDERVGGRLLVRLRSDIAIEAMQSSRWTWRDLATLCGIYAGIGRRKMIVLSRDRIGAMALGYTGQRERDAHDAIRLQLADHKTRYTIEKLDSRKWYCRATANGRHIWFSHRLSNEELEAALIDHCIRNQATESMTDRKKRIQAAIADGKPQLRLHG